MVLVTLIFLFMTYGELVGCRLSMICAKSFYLLMIFHVISPNIHLLLWRFYRLMLSSVASTSMIMFCNWWLDYFYRGELTLIAKEYKGGQLKSKKNSPLQVSSRPCITTLYVTREEELAAFLAFWLSRFALPHGRDVIQQRPSW